MVTCLTQMIHFVRTTKIGSYMIYDSYMTCTWAANLQYGMRNKSALQFEESFRFLKNNGNKSCM